MLVDWTNEEGSRFAPAMMSSGVWAGKLDRDWAWQRTDVDGMVFGEELERIGYKGALPCASWPFHAYFELHIEQGPMLERKGKTIGVPKGILCLHWYDIYVDGEANQVGPTPMAGRRDALVAAAEMILKVRELPAKMGGNMVATVGELQNYPNSRNIIPDRVHFTVDIRSWDDELALRSWDDVRADFEAIAARHGCAASRGGDLAGPAQRVRSPSGGAGADGRGGPWLLDSADGQRCRSRRKLRGHGRPDGHDLRPEHRRAQSRRGREHHAGRIARREPTCCFAACCSPPTKPVA